MSAVALPASRRALRREVRRATGQTVALVLSCCYLLSQIYMVPVAAVGSSWAMWPTLSDVTTILLALWLVSSGFSMRSLSVPQRHLVILFLTHVLLGAASFALLTANPLGLKITDTGNTKGVSVGAYQLYRLTQFLLILLVQTSIARTAERQRVWCWATGITLGITIALLTAEHFGLITTPQLSPQLPTDLATAGPWAYYSQGIVGRSVGTISFHHAYPPIQILTLAALFFHLLAKPTAWKVIGTMLAVIGSAFLIGSRTGLIAVLFFLVLLITQRLRLLLTAVPVMALLTAFLVFWSPNLSVIEPLIERHGTITSSFETDGFAGRVDIWEERLSLLADNPTLLLTGTGFGSAIETGVNGHLLFLHIVVECGIGGLLLFCYFLGFILRELWRHERRMKPLFCLTISLIVSCLTQETFYPVPGMGQFIGLYLFALATAFHNDPNRIANEDGVRRPGLAYTQGL